MGEWVIDNDVLGAILKMFLSRGCILNKWNSPQLRADKSQVAADPCGRLIVLPGTMAIISNEQKN